MPRTLKLVKGTGPGRAVRRRVTARRVPESQSDPVTALLEHLDEEPDSAASAPAVPAAADGGVWRRVRVGAALLALAAALATAVLFGNRWYAERQLAQAHQQALAAAKQTTVNFVSVSAASVDRDLARIVDGAAGDFKDEFTRGQAQVRAAVVANNVESRGAVLRAALVSGDRRSAVVLVAVDATVRNAKAPDGRPSHYRIQVELTRDPDSGRWLVSRLQFVG